MLLMRADHKRLCYAGFETAPWCGTITSTLRFWIKSTEHCHDMAYSTFYAMLVYDVMLEVLLTDFHGQAVWKASSGNSHHFLDP